MGSCFSKQTEPSEAIPSKNEATPNDTSNPISHLTLKRVNSSIKSYAHRPHKTESMVSLSQINHNASEQNKSLQELEECDEPPEPQQMDSSIQPNSEIKSNTALSPATPATPYTPYSPNTANTPNTMNTPIALTPTSPSPMSPISSTTPRSPMQENIPHTPPVVTNSNEIHTDLQESTVKPFSFAGLHEIFTLHATKDDKTKMNVSGLSEALKAYFGMIIDINPNLQKCIWNKFDLENEKEIDYFDFMATISSLIDNKNEDSLFSMFQIFDVNENGYLETNALADMLLAQKKMAIVVTKQRDENAVSLNCMKEQCLHKAKNMVANSKNNEKISFDEYIEMMLNDHSDA